jgi:hypothetical protein
MLAAPADRRCVMIGTLYKDMSQTQHLGRMQRARGERPTNG